MKPRHLIAAALLALLLVYPISIGPANWIDRHRGLPAWVTRFYAPLVDAYLMTPTATKVMHWYIRLWVGPD
jgi:hypothetical protein